MADYLIWSMRKHAWYRPDAQGYTDNVHEAGRYPREVVGSVITDALPGQLIPVDEVLAQNALADLQGESVTERLDTYRTY